MSILNDTKKVLGIDASYTAFDVDVITHINATMALLHQIGLGPEDGYFVEDQTNQWSDLDLPLPQLGMFKTWLYLNVRFLFDPPTTSFLLAAMEKQIGEFTWRLNVMRENEIYPAELNPPLIIDGGNP